MEPEKQTSPTSLGVGGEGSPLTKEEDLSNEFGILKGKLLFQGFLGCLWMEFVKRWPHSAEPLNNAWICKGSPGSVAKGGQLQGSGAEMHRNAVTGRELARERRRFQG